MSKGFPGAVQTHTELTTTTIAKLWRITRRDGQQFFFTDHDVAIPSGGDTFSPLGGFSSSAFSINDELASDKQDVTGLFLAAFVEKEDLEAGLFDGATYQYSIVNWKTPADGEGDIRQGTMGQVFTNDAGEFRVELGSQSEPLGQNFLRTFTAPCAWNVGDTNCKIPILPDVIQRSTAVTLGQFYRVPTLSTSSIAYSNILRNAGFELDTAGGNTTTVTGWTVTQGQVRIVTSNGGLSAHSGVNFLTGSTVLEEDFTVQQDILLTDIGITAAQVDAGSITATGSFQRAQTFLLTSDEGRVQVQALDSAGAFISNIYDSTLEAISPLDTWVLRSFASVAVPVNTRTIRVVLDGDALVAFGANQSAFDTCSVTLNDTVGPNTFQEIYENRVYEVTTAGTTAVSQPVYDEDIGDPTTDGTAVLIARDAFMRHAEITEVIDQKTFRIAITEARAVDDWFNGGVIEFQAGRNANISIEVRDWDQSDLEVTIFLPMRFPIVPGVKVRIHRGCDFELTTCNVVFDNVVNHGGFPHFPGNDRAIRYPDAR